jgi:hypothetical protein
VAPDPCRPLLQRSVAGVAVLILCGDLPNASREAGYRKRKITKRRIWLAIKFNVLKFYVFAHRDGSIVIQIQINLAVHSLLSVLRKLFPSEGHFLKLCTMTWRCRGAGEVTALSGAMQILGQFQHFKF